MLKAEDIKRLDMIQTFICALLDCICAESDSGPVRTVLTEYVDVMNKACCRNGWDKFRITH